MPEIAENSLRKPNNRKNINEKTPDIEQETIRVGLLIFVYLFVVCSLGLLVEFWFFQTLRLLIHLAPGPLKWDYLTFDLNLSFCKRIYRGKVKLRPEVRSYVYGPGAWSCFRYYGNISHVSCKDTACIKNRCNLFWIFIFNNIYNFRNII